MRTDGLVHDSGLADAVAYDALQTLGDRWYTFDARNNTPRIGRVLMARGRDACDVALVSTFGANTLQRFEVWADEENQTPRLVHSL